MNLPAALILLAFIAPVALSQEVQETPDAANGEPLEEVTRLQIFLDRAEFSPGKIDGRLGQFTLEALALYREAHGGAANPDPDVIAGEEDAIPELGDLDLPTVDPLFLSYEVSSDDLQHVGKLPGEISEQAQLKAMPYRSAAEAIAEKFHMAEEYLDKLNPGKTENLKEGDVLRVANVVPFEMSAIEELKQKIEEKDEDKDEDKDKDKDEDKDETEDKEPPVAEDEEEPGSNEATASDATNEVDRDLLVHINTETNMLTVYESDTLIAAYPVTVGSGQTESPAGEWKVTGISVMPNFRHDKSMLKQGVRSDDFHILPPGPNNPVGVIWIQLNKEGIGIHGTNDPGTIGRSSSHGCVRLANWDAVRFVEKIGVDVPVTIQAGPR